MTQRIQTFSSSANLNRVIERIRATGSNAFIKKGTFITEVIWGGKEKLKNGKITVIGGKSFMFYNQLASQRKDFKKGLFLFTMVRRDAAAFLKTKQEIVIPKQEPTLLVNKEFRDAKAKITGTDINHAYWRIALNLNVITERTYEKGLKPELKEVRLAALSTLGRGRNYQKIELGDFTDEMITVNEDAKLQDIYTAIRYNCYRYMKQISKLLGDDFIKYKTDAIYYRRTPENIKMVHEFLKSKNLSVKQLV